MEVVRQTLVPLSRYMGYMRHDGQVQMTSCVRTLPHTHTKIIMFDGMDTMIRDGHLQKIRKGNFGRVYLSTHNGQHVAIKKIPVRCKSQEAEILLGLQSHVNICGFFDSIETQHYLYIYMPYYHKNLHEHIYNRCLLPKQRKVFIKQILCGLAHVHAHGVIHRDLTPHNILVDDRDAPAQGQIKICDFGMSCYTADGASEAYVCSFPYRAIELLKEAGGYSTSMDIWAAGCILAEMATQSILFDKETVAEQIQAIEAFPGSSSLSDFMDTWEMDCVDRMLNKNHRERFAANLLLSFML